MAAVSGLLFIAAAGFGCLCFRPMTMEQRVARLQQKSNRNVMSSSSLNIHQSSSNSHLTLSKSTNQLVNPTPPFIPPLNTTQPSAARKIKIEPELLPSPEFQKKIENLIDKIKPEVGADHPVIYDTNGSKNNSNNYDLVRAKSNTAIAGGEGSSASANAKIDIEGLKLSPAFFLASNPANGMGGDAKKKKKDGSKLAQEIKDRTSSRSVSCFTKTRTNTNSFTIEIKVSDQLVVSIPGHLKLDFEEDVELSDQVGVGSSGVVRKGKLKNPLIVNDADNAVAVKIMTQADEADFKYETAIMGSIPENMYVVYFVGYFEGSVERGIVLKLYDHTLSQLIFDKTFTITAFDAIKIAHDVAQGMDHVHKHGIIHFDLKPRNILVDIVRLNIFGQNDGNSDNGYQCVIGDFGVGMIILVDNIPLR